MSKNFKFQTLYRRLHKQRYDDALEATLDGEADAMKWITWLNDNNHADVIAEMFEDYAHKQYENQYGDTCPGIKAANKWFTEHPEHLI